MDYFTIVLTCCLAILANAAHIPEVYESNPQKQTQENYERPPVFNYQEYQKAQKGNQFDPQRIRYQQQQQLDAKPRQPKNAEFSTEFSRPLTTTFVSTSTSVGSSSGSPETITSPTRVALEDLEKDSSQTRTPKGKISKKSLKPNSYMVNEEAEGAGSRQDDSSYINYVDRGPKIVSQNLGGFSVAPTAGDQLTALSSLLGQTPENQLHGLQQLLNDRGHQGGHNGGYYKDHTPIREDVLDYPHNQNRPNVNTRNNHAVNQALQSLNQHGNNPNALKSLQAQLDATASAHAENIIAQAQKKALEHVKAQHEAIARAQKQAEQVALEQIKAQNEALARAHAQAQEEAEAKRQEDAKEDKRKAAERRRQQEQARERARIAALAYKHKQEQQQKEKEAKDGNSDDSYSVAQNTRAKNAHKHKKYQIAEPAETQNHYFTTHAHAHPQPQFTPVQLFPQAVSAPVVHSPAASQHKPVYEQKPKPKYNAEEDHAEVDKYYIPPQFTVIGHTKNAHGEEELQYAANYEFGYRIRDYDHGNDYGHKESKDGDTTKGEYHALLPDGRIQTVTYYVDDSGYHADVSYGGDH